MRPFAFLLLYPIVLAVPVVGQGRPKVAQEVSVAAAPLPITRVSLYKNGVGFFEHAGRVTGNGSVTIDFTTAQLNDVLQTLTAIDLDGGRIARAGYNSTTPLEQQLKSLPIALGEDPSAVDFYNAIRGARVEVLGAGGTITGRLLSVEVRTVPSTKEESVAEKRFLTVVSDAGAVRTVELTSATSVRLLDTRLHEDVTRYLEILASNRNSGLRHLTLQDNGTGARALRVSYLSEVPIWKSTYRILFTDAAAGKQTATLQGWSVVDNTTGSDWVNVQMALVAGAPQSFIQPLSTPYYSRRPEIALPQNAQLSPQTHESADEITGSPKAAGVAGMGSMGGSAGGSLGGVGIAPKEIKMLKEDAAPPQEAFTLRSNLPVNGRAYGGVMGGIASAPAPYEQAAADSIAPQTTMRAFDDFFEYKIAEPVTIRKNESAMVPILQTKIDAERVTLWSVRQPTALRALWMTNTSKLTLDRGSFAIVEDGSFGGEGLLDAIHPGERRLLSYAADQAVRVTTDYGKTTRRVQHLSIAKGVLKETTAEVAEVEYMVKNAAPEARTVVVEQPVRVGWTLDSEPKPTETTPTAYRFRVETKAGETVRLHIGERHTVDQFFRLVNTSDEQLTVVLRNAKASPALMAQLEPVFAAKAAVAGLDRGIREKQNSVQEITNDQKRLRDNLSALKGSAEERALVKRYTDELNGQEDRLATLNKEIASLKQQRVSAEGELERKIGELNFDEAM